MRERCTECFTSLKAKSEMAGNAASKSDLTVKNPDDKCDSSTQLLKTPMAITKTCSMQLTKCL